MQSILDAINEWIKEILIGAINGNLSTMFGDVNEKVGTIAAEVGQTPQGWNANIFSMIQTLSENVIVPIAGLVITYVLCYELISMVTEKNNMHDVDTSMFFKWVFKAFVAVYLVTHTFDITMAVFDMAQGTNIWCDAMVIPANAENPLLAHEFINYMLTYEAAFDNTETVGYTSPNAEVFEEMTSSEDLYAENAAYLPRSGYEKDEMFHDNQTLMRELSKLWIKVKAAK